MEYLDENKRLYSPEEIAKMLSVSLTYVYKLFKVAGIEVIKIGRLSRVDEEGLKKLLEYIQSSKRKEGRTR